MSQRFEELDGLVKFTQDCIDKVAADLAADGTVTIMDAVKLVASEAGTAFNLAMNAKEIMADTMTEDERMALLKDAMALVENVALLFIKK